MLVALARPTVKTILLLSAPEGVSEVERGVPSQRSKGSYAYPYWPLTGTVRNLLQSASRFDGEHTKFVTLTKADADELRAWCNDAANQIASAERHDRTLVEKLRAAVHAIDAARR